MQYLQVLTGQPLLEISFKMVSLRNLISWIVEPVAFGMRKRSERATGNIRRAMLASLQDHSGGQYVQRVAQRVKFAEDLETLWYLRQDLMTALTDLDGEGAARQKIHQINRMFKGRLPSAMGPRTHRR